LHLLIRICSRSLQVAPGQNVPQDVQFQVLEEGADEPRAVGYQELFEGKRVVLFGLPGEPTGERSIAQ
jgi:peroxiredoxin